MAFLCLFLPFAFLLLPYLMTLSARASTFGGIVRPICLAAFRLIMNSNFVGCSTGRSAGFAPFRILSTYAVNFAWLLRRSELDRS